MKMNNFKKFNEFAYNMLHDYEITIRILQQNLDKPTEYFTEHIIHSMHHLSNKIRDQKRLRSKDIKKMVQFRITVHDNFDQSAIDLCLSELKTFQLLNSFVLGHVVESFVSTQKSGSVWNKENFYPDMNSALCIRQLEQCTILLLQILRSEIENDVVLKNTRFYVLNRIQWCLSELKEKSPAIEPGSFLRMMDSVLEQILALDLNATPELSGFKKIKETIDELLCHAMTVGQVALDGDKKTIKAGCQNVLTRCEEFGKEIEKTDTNSYTSKFLLEALTNSLYSIEKRVNIAVLWLLLEVLTSKHTQILKFQEHFKSKSLNMDRNNSDLDNEIIELDLHSDRIMQIGFFAISCSTDKQKIFKIRNILASLESLEAELVPALTARYICTRNDWLETDLHANLLIRLWCDEIDCLENQIHLIVDPFAFSRVVLEYNTKIGEKIQCYIKKQRFDKVCVKAKEICRCAEMYRRHLKTLKIEAVKSGEITEELLKLENDFSKIVKETLKFTEACENPQNNNLEFFERFLKRVQVLITINRRINQLHGKEINVSNDFEDNTRENSNENSQTTQTSLEKHIQKLPSSETLERAMDVKNKPMALLMLRSEVLRKEQSILYQSPRKNKPNKEMTCDDNWEILHISESVDANKTNKWNRTNVFERCEKTVDDIELNITAILEELTTTCVAQTAMDESEIFV